MKPNLWTEKDLENVKEFGKFINEHAKWNIDTNQSVRLFGFLSWYNSLSPKINESIFEIKRAVDEKGNEMEPEKPKSRRRGKKQ